MIHGDGPLHLLFSGALTETELYERFHPLLRAFGRRHLRDASDADELAQETLVIVLAALREGRVESIDNVGGYVLGVARNLVREGWRRDRRSRAALSALAPLAVSESPEPELEHGLRKCISKLTARARAVLQRAIALEESGPEIARALGISEGNVRVIRHRALAEVRRCLQTGGA